MSAPILLSLFSYSRFKSPSRLAKLKSGLCARHVHTKMSRARIAELGIALRYRGYYVGRACNLFKKDLMMLLIRFQVWHLAC